MDLPRVVKSVLPKTLPTGLRFADITLAPSHLTSVLGAPPARAQLAVRRNEANLSVAEQDAFKNAVTKMIDQGTYAKFVEIHHNMGYRMHTLPATVTPTPASGTWRFLPWHRVFLTRFQEDLTRIDPAVTIPYWDWTKRREIPPWLVGFEPNGITREPEDPDGLPSRPDIWMRLRLRPYGVFTLALEGWTPQVPQGTAVRIDGAHNRVHVWVGGDMADVMISPKDPLFWLHHAETDRLWHVWQQENPGDHPLLLGPDQVMDPWAETYPQIQSIHALGYRYEDETFNLQV